MKTKMNITVVGAGNIGTQFAVHCAEKLHRCTVYGSKPERINNELTIINEKDEEIHRGTICGATSDDRAAFENADLIFVTMPAYCMDEVAKKIHPYARAGMKICLVPGTGGGECAFKACIEKGAVLFGLQRVPSVARLVEYGKCVRATGYRDELQIASLPGSEAEECAGLISGIFDRKCTPLPNYLNLTLTPSNPILHTTRLKALFKDYKEGTVYERVPLFYEEWNDESSELLLKCDDEVQKLCNSITGIDLSHVKSLRIHYESPTAEAMTKKLSSIAGFKGLTSPTVKVDGGYAPDFKSRYFTADFPYGLSILMQIADFVGMDVPNMRETLNWYYGLVGKQKGFQFSDYGIETLNQFLEFYMV